MQIFNNVQSPNFGALKIDKGALKKLPKDSAKDLKEISKDLKNTKFFDLKIDKDLNVRITGNKNAYFGEFNRGDYYAESFGKDAIVINTPNMPLARVDRYKSEGKASIYDVWGFCGTNDIKDAYTRNMMAKVTKLLDDTAVAEYKKAAQTKI